MKKIIVSLSLFICILAPITQVQADSYEVSVTNSLASNRNLIGELFGGSTSAFIEDSSKQELVIKNEKPIAVTIEIYDNSGTLIKSMIVPPMLDGKINKAKELLLESPISIIKGFINEGFFENHTKTGFNIENLPEGGSIKFIRGESDAIAITAVATAINSFDAFGELLGADKSSALLVALYKKAIKDPALISNIAITVNDSSMNANKKAKQITSIVASFIGNESIKIVEKVSWKQAFGENSPAIKKGLKSATKSITILASLEKAGASLAMASNMTRDLSRGKLTMTQQGFSNTNPYTSYGKSLAKKEVDPVVTTILKPTQAEIDVKAKAQLLISSQLSKSNRSLNTLKSQLRSKKRALRRLESQVDSTPQQQNNISTNDIDTAKRKIKYFLQAYIINKKYNGDLNGISGKDLVKLKILSRNTFGTASNWRTLFSDSKSLANNQKRAYESLKRRYNLRSQQHQASGQNNAQIAQLRRTISRLEQDIIRKRRELTNDQIRKNDLDFIIMNLTDSFNDDNKAIVALGQKPRPTTSLMYTINDYNKAPQTPRQEPVSPNQESIAPNQGASSHLWAGSHTRVHYQENSGNLYFGGFGGGRAETKEIKPGNGTILYLHQSSDNNPADERTRTLSQSEASYFGNYSYTAWGTWSDPNATQKIYTSHWVVTDTTPNIDMPKQGNATYQGELVGGQWTIGNTGYNSMNGGITLNADFGTNTITGNITIQNASSGATWGTASISNGTINSSQFDGKLVGAGISNAEVWHSQISGDFGGPQANETGGIWSVTKGTGANGDERAVGVFRAKKQ